MILNIYIPINIVTTKVFVIALGLICSILFQKPNCDAAKEDRVTYHGKWKVDLPIELQNINYKLVHIPKSGGASFLAQSPEFLPVGTTLHGNRERSLNQTNYNRSQSILYVRSPREHVLSQFLECKYDWWGKSVTKDTGFPGKDKTKVYNGFKKWAEHFARTNFTHSYNCYNPWNMQARYLATPHGHLIPKEYPDDREPKLELAITELNTVGFFGITEYSDVTLCLFQYHVARTVSEACTCDKKTGRLKIRNFEKNITHGVPAHNISDLSDDIVKTIDTLTKIDKPLYDYALGQFLKRKAHVEKELGISFDCKASESQAETNKHDSEYSVKGSIHHKNGAHHKIGTRHKDDTHNRNKFEFEA